MVESVMFKLLEASTLATSNLPAGREKSMVLTKLDEARLWCKELQAVTAPASPPQIPALDEILTDGPPVEGYVQPDPATY